MITPGYYKTNYRGLGLGEIARMHGWVRAPLAYLVTRFKEPSPFGWMPLSWADLKCERQDLSERCWQATAPHREAFQRLGFRELGFKKVRGILNPVILDNGGINYLDATGSHFGQLIYHRVYLGGPNRAAREQVTIAFTAVFEDCVLSYTNNRKTFDALPRQKVVRCRSEDAPGIHQAFRENLARQPEIPRRFPDEDSLRHWFDSNQMETLEHRMRKGLYVRMTEAEVEAARRKLPPPLPAGT